MDDKYNKKPKKGHLTQGMDNLDDDLNKLIEDAGFVMDNAKHKKIADAKNKIGNLQN
jgi:hypothetical protein